MYYMYYTFNIYVLCIIYSTYVTYIQHRWHVVGDELKIHKKYVLKLLFGFQIKNQYFLLTKIKTSILHHFEAYECLVKIYDPHLSAHNQTKLLTGSIYPPENSKSTELPTVQFLGDFF